MLFDKVAMTLPFPLLRHMFALISVHVQRRSKAGSKDTGASS